MSDFRIFGLLLSAAGLVACGSGEESLKEEHTLPQETRGVSNASGAGDDPLSAPAARAAEGERDLGPVKRKLSPRLISPEPMLVSLPALPAAKTQPQVPAAGEALQVGLGRDLVETRSKALLQQLKWQPAENGTLVGAVHITSTGARGVRLGVLMGAVPGSARFRVYAPGKLSDAHEISAHEVLQMVAQNAQAGDLSDEGRTWWTPEVKGAEVVLEVELPPGVSPSAVSLSIPSLSHVYLDDWAEVLLSDAAKNGQSDSCNIDAVCRSEHSDLSDAVARMRYVKSGSSYLCTGTLLNDKDTTTWKPYFISAAHCISTQTVASTLQTDWFYRSPSCNVRSTTSAMRTVSGGATLLYANAGYDTSFMQLNAAVPGGVTYAGWNANAQSQLDVIGLHHPSGDWLKFSNGRIVGQTNCTPLASGGFTCSGSSGNHHAVRWSQGTTEGGSSGSGIFNNNQLFGVLHGGSASCSNPSGEDKYGRFDLAYADGVSRWLNNAATPTPTPTPTPSPTPGVQRSAVYRFFNATSGAHFFSGSAAERDFVISTMPVFKYEGVAFYAASQAAAGMSPVYRFFNSRTGAHFYTISAAERDYVRSDLPVFAYEGPSWYASASGASGMVPVYRFFNQRSGAHFYTSSADERDFVIRNYRDFAYEAVAYHVWTAP